MMKIIWKYNEHTQSSQQPNLAALRHLRTAVLEKPEVDWMWQSAGSASASSVS